MPTKPRIAAGKGMSAKGYVEEPKAVAVAKKKPAAKKKAKAKKK